MKCESWKDLETLIINSEVKPLQNKVPSEEYQRLWSLSRDKAKTLWEQLLEKNQKFYKSDGSLDIEYLPDKKIYRRKPLKRGQPCKEVKKDTRKTIRLDADLQEILDNYCQTNNCNESEAIRDAIKNLRFHNRY